MEFLPVNPQNIARAAEILRNGGLVAFPTETVYGLGADAFNPQALAKIFEVKQRPFFDPLIIHIASIGDLEKTADLSLLDSVRQKKVMLLAEKLWPGPLSLVLPKNEKIPGIATAGLPAAAIRFPAHKAALELISLSGTAVAAPSANPFGSLSPTRARHVRDKLGDKIDMILDGGPARIGVESTVLDVSNERIKILRPGGTSKELIEELTGPVEEAYFINEKPNNTGLSSPGRLKSHYAPVTPMNIFQKNEIINKKGGKDRAFLFFDAQTRDAWLKTYGGKGGDTVEIRVLSAKGELLEAASHLFDTLHELDSLKISKIYAQLAPDEGLGTAINDRLRRASGV
ncbi:MAG: threonylcarbamoyl-AMP synthase [Treponema sp.]|jgi:L-threonylcarbamoyladenylate synthase|nr:threonylcarbamoyl-AMP synthase [Treponema sp.]